MVSLINYTLSNSDVESLATTRGINSKESLDEYNGGNDNIETINEDDTIEANMTRHTVSAVGIQGDQEEQLPQELSNDEVTDSVGQLEDECLATKVSTSEFAPILMQAQQSPVVPEGFSIVDDVACDQCDFMTARLGTLQKHVAKMHGGSDLNNQGSEDSDSTDSEDDKPLIRLRSGKTKKRKRGRPRKDKELTVKDNSIRRERSAEGTRNKSGPQQLWKVNC